MTDEIDIMKKALSYYDSAIRIKRMNQELYDHLLGSIIWLLKYSERYSIPLPKKQELYSMIKRAEFLINEVYSNDSSDENLQDNKSDGDLTEPQEEIQI